MCNKTIIEFGLCVDCSQCPPFFREIEDVDHVDRWVRRAAILVSWCEGNWGGSKMPLSRGNGIKSVGVSSTTPTPPIPPPPPLLPTGILYSPRIKRPRWRPVELNDWHQWYHGKIGDCEKSKFVLSGMWYPASADYTCRDLDYSVYHKNLIQLLFNHTSVSRIDILQFAISR